MIDYLIDINDLDPDNVLIDAKSQKNVLIFDVTYKTTYSAKIFYITLIKQMVILENMKKLDIQHYIILKSLMEYSIKLDVLYC